MVFYFSATGNSLWAAKRLSESFECGLVSVANILKNEHSTHFSIGKDEPCFFVFPVNSWGPEPLMLRFISKLTLDGYARQPVYAVCTCGDDCGYTKDMLADVLAARAIKLTDCWSVTMPNNYILMKGFGIDSDEVRDRKLQQAQSVLDNIIKSIRNRQSFKHYETGKFAFVKSRIINKLFNKFVIGGKTPSLFRVTERCTGCGLCERICPSGAISTEGKKPVWNKGCVQCTACINRCPARAIEYGNVTVSQGRYCHPELKNSDLV